MGRPISIIQPATAPWRTIYESFDFNGAGVWTNSSEFNLLEVDGIIGVHSGWFHENLGGGTNTFRAINGTPAGIWSEDTYRFQVIVRNIDSLEFAWGMRDPVTGNFARVDWTWETMSGAFVNNNLGSNTFFSVKQIAPEVWLFTVQSDVFAASIGNNKHIIIYPTGRDTNTDRSVIYQARIQVLDHWS